MLRCIASNPDRIRASDYLYLAACLREALRTIYYRQSTAVRMDARLPQAASEFADLLSGAADGTLQSVVKEAGTFVLVACTMREMKGIDYRHLATHEAQCARMRDYAIFLRTLAEPRTISREERALSGELREFFTRLFQQGDEEAYSEFMNGDDGDVA